MDRTARMMSRQQGTQAGGRAAEQQAMYNESVDATAPRYREEFGFAMTDQGYGQLLEHQEKFGGSVADAQKALSSARKQVKGAKGPGTIEQGWDKFRGGWSKINIVNKDKSEGTYYLPKEAIDKLNSGTFNQGDGSYVGKWSDDQYYVDVTPQGTDEKFGKELHEALGGAEGEVRDKFWEKNEGKYKDAQKLYDSERKRAEAMLGAEQKNLDAAVYMNETELAHHEEQFQKKRTAKRNLFALSGE